MQFKRRLKTSAVADLVPLIDVIFQLVIFFMVSSTFVQLPGIVVSEPESETAETVIMDRLVITVKSESDIFVNDTKTDLKNLERSLKAFRAEAVKNPENDMKSVVLSINEDVSVAVLTKVRDAVILSGFQDSVVSMKVRQK